MNSVEQKGKIFMAYAGIWYLPFPENISLHGWRIDRVATLDETKNLLI